MDMGDRDGLIWMDGEWLPWRDANVHVLSHTLHYGMGVFEGIRAYETDKGLAVFRLEEHVDRLFDSAKILRMDMPYSKDEIRTAILEVGSKNNLGAHYIRPLCFYGSESMGIGASNLKVHVAIAAWEWGAYLGAEGLEKGVRLCVSSYTRHHINAAMTKAKAVGHYINSRLAQEEAVTNGYDEALLLDPQGFVAEGSGENFFMVHNGELITPLVTSALNGITRHTLMTLAEGLGLPVKERLITRDEVYIADEAFFTGTAAEVTPIRELDGRQIGSGKRGPITEQLQQLYFDLVQGRYHQHAEWLTPVK